MRTIKSLIAAKQRPDTAKARAVAEALGTEVSWLVKCAVTLTAHSEAAAHQTETIAWLIAGQAAHYGRMALGEQPWHYLPTMATPEEARAVAEALGTEVSWLVKCAVTLTAHAEAAAHQTETIAWLIAGQAAHYGRMALGEQ